MSDSNDKRIVVNAHTTAFLPYDLEGPVQAEMSWLPVRFHRETRQGSYPKRSEPGGGRRRRTPTHGGAHRFTAGRGERELSGSYRRSWRASSTRGAWLVGPMNNPEKR